MQSCPSTTILLPTRDCTKRVRSNGCSGSVSGTRGSGSYFSITKSSCSLVSRWPRLPPPRRCRSSQITVISSKVSSTSANVGVCNKCGRQLIMYLYIIPPYSLTLLKILPISLNNCIPIILKEFLFCECEKSIGKSHAKNYTPYASLAHSSTLVLSPHQAKSYRSSTHTHLARLARY